MQKLIILFAILLCPHSFSVVEEQELPTQEFSKTSLLYKEMQLDGIVCYEAFRQAMIGYNKIEKKREEVLTLIDFSKPSTEKRLYVLNLKDKKLLFTSLVSHGRNSGENYATSFSNKSGSYQSSLGFYRTENTYNGGNGYSLILEGLEKGINDRAKARAIVMHGASYCCADYIASTGRLGRSFGCPSVPHELAKPIIDTIKDGTLLYIYANNKVYASHSPILTDGEAV